MLRFRSIALLLMFATLVIFLPATSCHFINYDDPQYVVQNPFVNRGLSWEGIKWAFLSSHASNWHPLTWISLMVDCDLFRLNPAGPHLINILLHAANAALLFGLMYRLLGKLWPSAFIAALFAWHPLHVESVAWVSERKDVLSTFFSLLALLSYIRYAQAKAVAAGSAAVAATGRPPVRDYTLSLIFFALALMSKAMPVTLPMVMLLLDFWPLNRLSLEPSQWRNAGRLLLEKVPFLLLSLAVCFITVHVQHHAESSLTTVSLGLRMENAVSAYATYLGMMVWPMHLAIFYPYQASISHLWLAEASLLLILLSLLAWRERASSPWLLVGWLWYLGTLVPVIGLVQVGAQSMADRYTYFPLVGIFLAVSCSLSALTERFAASAKWVAGLAVLVLVLCVPLTERQLSYWQNSETLFRHSLAVRDSEVGHLSLGIALAKENRKEALHQYILAWLMHPDSVLANANVAGVLAEEGRPKLAAVYYQRAITNDTWTPSVFENYGRVLVTLKRYDEAVKQFSAAERISPSSAKPHLLKARLWLQQGQDVKAVAEFRQAIKRNPYDVQALVSAASVMSASENPRARNGHAARKFALRAVKLSKSRQPAALDALAMSDAELGKFGDAILIQQQAIKLAGKIGQSRSDLAFLEKRLRSYQQHHPWRESFKFKFKEQPKSASTKKLD